MAMPATELPGLKAMRLLCLHDIDEPACQHAPVSCAWAVVCHELVEPWRNGGGGGGVGGGG